MALRRVETATNPWQTFGELLRMYRREGKLTQVALATEIGVSRQLIAFYEKDDTRRRPTREMAKRLAAALGLGREQTSEFILALDSPLARDFQASRMLNDLRDALESTDSVEARTKLITTIEEGIRSWRRLTAPPQMAILLAAGQYVSDDHFVDAIARIRDQVAGIPNATVVVTPRHAGRPFSSDLENRRIQVACQQEPKGTGSAFLSAQEYVGNEETVAVAFADNSVHLSEFEAMLKVYSRYGHSVVALQKASPDDRFTRGIVEFEPVDETTCRITAMYEKPGLSVRVKANQGAIVGRFILDRVWLKGLKSKQGREDHFDLTSALQQILEQNKDRVYGHFCPERTVHILKHAPRKTEVRDFLQHARAPGQKKSP